MSQTISSLLWSIDVADDDDAAAAAAAVHNFKQSISSTLFSLSFFLSLALLRAVDVSLVAW